MKKTKYRKLINNVDYPLFMRYSEFSKTPLKTVGNNASDKHQVKQGYRTYPLYKEIIVVKIINENTDVL